jgi:hypothetical protein
MATKTTAFKCTNCQGDILVEVPPHEIFNGVMSSALVFVHHAPDVCNHCGQHFVFAIDKSKPQTMFYGWVPIVAKAEKPSSIIEPPAGTNWSELLKKKPQ